MRCVLKHNISGHRSREDRPADDQPLDLIGPLVDLVGGLRREALGLRAEHGRVLALVKHDAGVADQKSGRVNLGLALRQDKLGVLEGRQGLAEHLSVL